MKKLFFSFILTLGALSLLAAPATVRKTVVMAQGESLPFMTEAPIATISTPAGTNEGKEEVVRYLFQQYDRNITLQALKLGEAKLLIENTDSHIGEVVKVVVTNKDLAARYRYVTGSLAGIVGLSPEDVHVAGDRIVVTGKVYSMADLNRCDALASQGAPPPAKGRKAKPVANPIICLTRLSSAAPAIFPDRGYIPAVNLQVDEQVPGVADANMPGGEGVSMWSATVRFGDVPVLTMDSSDRAGLIRRVSDLAGSLDKASAEWRAQAEKGSIYPTVFRGRSTGTNYEISMVWKFDQGTKGVPLIQVSPQEVQHASMMAGGAGDRLISWWTAILQDTFRLYYLGQRPSGTLSSSNKDPLMPLYESAVRLTGGKFDRTNSAIAVARGYYALKAVSGQDPFQNLLTSPPTDFSGVQVDR
ncbi:MAG: hypothetical protein ABI718_06635 [Acidobacteriota bacterium]